MTSVVTTLAFASSPQSLWLMVNQFQLLLLLPICGAEVPKDIQDYLAGMDFALFNFGFLPYKDLWVSRKISEYLHRDQNNEYLDTIGLESSSAIVNQLPLIYTILVLVFFHLCLLILKLILT